MPIVRPMTVISQSEVDRGIPGVWVPARGRPLGAPSTVLAPRPGVPVALLDNTSDTDVESPSGVESRSYVDVGCGEALPSGDAVAAGDPVAAAVAVTDAVTDGTTVIEGRAVADGAATTVRDAEAEGTGDCVADGRGVAVDGAVDVGVGVLGTTVTQEMSPMFVMRGCPYTSAVSTSMSGKHVVPVKRG